jgi:WD40 repeat protein
VAFSRDGRIVASGSQDATIRLWEADGGKCITTLCTGAPVWGTAFAPRCEAVASLATWGGVQLWDVATGKERDTFGRNEVFGDSFAFSPNGKILAVATLGEAGRPRTELWDIDTKKRRLLIGHSGIINNIAFSPDGKLLASASDDSTTKLWDVATGKNLATLMQSPMQFVGSVAFSPNGKTLVSGGRDGWIIFWDVATSKKKSTLRGGMSTLWCVGFSPDGTILAAGNLDGTIELWDVVNLEIVDTLVGHRDGVLCLAFSPDGHVLASASQDKTVKLWDMTKVCHGPAEPHNQRKQDTTAK